MRKVKLILLFNLVVLVSAFMLTKAQDNGKCGQYCLSCQQGICMTCVSGYYQDWTDKYCLPCNMPNCQNCDNNGTQCYQCMNGTYLTQDGSQCLPLPTSMTNCNSGYISPGQEPPVIICEGCVSKFYVNATNQCAPCPNGCESCYLGYLPDPVTHRKDAVPVVTCTSQYETQEFLSKYMK